MRTLSADQNRDLALDAAGNLSLVSGQTAIEKTAEQYAQARRGEMVHAMDRGIPFDLIVWGGTPNVAQYEAAIRARLLQVPDVVEVLALSARQVGDVLGYTATIRTNAGEAVISG